MFSKYHIKKSRKEYSEMMNIVAIRRLGFDMVAFSFLFFPKLSIHYLFYHLKIYPLMGTIRKQDQVSQEGHRGQS